MKYHKYEIIKEPTDLGESDSRLNYTYKIYKNGEYKTTALTLSTAKEYINHGENDIYL